MNPRGHRFGAAGFGLVEVLASLALFSVVAVGVSASIVNGTRANFQSRMQATASALAQNKLEQLRAITPGATTPADLTTGTHVDSGNPLTGIEGSGGNFTRTWTVAGVKDYLNGSYVGLRPNMARIEVTVTWTTPAAGSVKVVTYTCKSSNCG